MSENNYANPYLIDNSGFYRQQLSDMKDRDSYYAPERHNSFIEDAIKLAGLVTAIGGAGHLLYNSGLTKNFMHKFMMDFANQKGVLTVANAMEDVKKMTSRKSTTLIEDVADIIHNNTIQKSITKTQSAHNAEQTLQDLKLIKELGEKGNVIKNLESKQSNLKNLESLHKMLDKEIQATHNYDIVKNVQMLKSIGMKEATVRDLMNAKKLSAYAIERINMNVDRIPGLLNKVADEHVLIDEAGKIVDFRPAIKSVRKMGASALKDFQLPVININIMKMFHVADILDEDSMPKFHVINPGEIQHVITHKAGNVETKGSYVYSNGKIINAETANIIEQDVHLAPQGHGFQATHIRKLTNVQVRTFENKLKGSPGGEALFKAFKLLDLDMQDEVYNESLKFLTPSTWLPNVSKFIFDKVSPVASIPTVKLTESFGKDTKYIVVRNAKKIGTEGSLDQWFAGRKNVKAITEVTSIPFMLMERMNSALKTVNLGLSTESLGSATDVFVNLMAKRILPVVVGIGAVTYLSQVTGKNHPLADGYVTASVNVANMKDHLGVTGFMKKLKELSPGWDQLEEIPIIGRFFSTKNADETKKYWESGDDPVRKGRYWSLGNTPFTGGRTDYYEPNWVRRAKSDYKYTDVMYGSKDEYFKNWWLPTPTHPLAPLRHFIFDPYHWENKHMKDRPYPIAGGIPELKEIPLIGSALDSTVGRVLKPAKKMHLEYWQGNKLKDTNYIESSMFADSTRPALSIKGYPGKETRMADKSKQLVAYTTSSGQTQIMYVDKNTNMKQLNAKLKTVSVKATTDVENLDMGNVKYGPQKDKTIIPVTPRGMSDMFSDTRRDIQELAGFYGFSMGTVIGEDRTISKPRIASSMDMTSYSRSFWDKNLGGYGGDLSEMFRRFVPKKPFNQAKAELNPIRNTMPTWLPGREYYIDFQHGDPYAKITKGEYRLPGTGYEAMHNISDPTTLNIGSSFIGHTKDEIVKHFLKVDDIELTQNATLNSVLKNGTRVHTKMEKEWKQLGLAVANEVKVEDKEHGIEGWIDVIIKDKTSKTGYSIADFKTISDKGYKEIARTHTGKPENIAQVNFYMYKAGMDKAYLHYINRENPDAPAITLQYNFDKKLLDQTFAKLESARNVVRQGLKNGQIARGDLYDPLDRFKILADVAPYSDNFKFYSQIVSNMDLTDEQKLEVRQVRDEVSDRKQEFRIYPYKFRNTALKYETVTIKQVLDNGTISTKEYGDNPIKLAGIKFSHGKTVPEGVEAMNYLHTIFKPGQKVRIGYTTDEVKKVNRDTYRTISAVVMKNGHMVNKEMMKRGLAQEKESDDSAAGINARYSTGQIIWGKIWEKLAHADTMFNTKFMQVRSALEQYKRRDLYGKDWQTWEHPIKDFLVPSIQNTLSHGFVQSVFMGALIGSMFGSNKYGRLVGAAIGGLTMATLSAGVTLKEWSTGQKWIPERRQKERNLNEYIDILKYVKNTKLYEKYRQMAIKKEHVDPAEVIRQNKLKGDNRKIRIKTLTKLKQSIKGKKVNFEQALEQSDYKDMGIKDMDALVKQINKDINGSKNDRRVEKITPLAAQAIMYYNESKKTLYGYNPGDPLQNVLTAFNRKERRYVQPFMDADPSERKEILQLVPNYMRRVLQSAYGVPVDTKPDLEEYFTHHALPGKNWVGWNADVDLDDVKVKMVKHEAMDMSEFDYWPDDEMRADHLDIPVPKINMHQKSRVVKDKLREVLGQSGLRDIDVQVAVTHTPGINMNVRIENDRTNDIKGYVNKYGVM